MHSKCSALLGLAEPRDQKQGKAHYDRLGIVTPKPLRWLVVLASILIMVAGCASAPATATPSIPEPTATPTSAPNPPATLTPTSLSLWLPDWMAFDTTGAGTVLQEIIDAFSAEQGVTINIVAKPPRGEGGLLDFLAKSYPVAPGILPDVIALPLTDASIAAAGGYLQPIDPLLDPALQQDVYSFAPTIARSGDAWYAIPFVVDFEHLAFQPSALSDPPVDWRIVLDSRATYAFPAGGPDAILTDALVVHYLSALGATDAAPRNEEALRQTLQFYETARVRRIIDSSTLQASQAEATWTRAVQGDVVMAHTTASLWLAAPEQVTTLRFGPIPTADSTPRYLIRGWAYAIVTADEQRQALSARLIETLMEPSNLARWSQAAHQLPARPSALAQWPATSYTAFASEALGAGIRPPDWVNDPTLARSLHRAMLDVLSGAATSDAATLAATGSW